jgi:hypothetical protein
VEGAKFAGAVAAWIEDLSRSDWLRFYGDLMELRSARDDPEERFAHHLGGKLRGFLFYEGKDLVERTLSYYVAPDGRYLFLTLFRLDRTHQTEVGRAREAMTKAEAAGHSVDTL